nr:hypothetical protein [uncultured Acetatifactor sp.]
MKLNDKYNLEFVNNPDRIEAEKKMHDVVDRIRDEQRFQGNAHYYLTIMPGLLKKLEKARDELTILEAKLEYELGQKQSQEEQEEVKNKWGLA